MYYIFQKGSEYEHWFLCFIRKYGYTRFRVEKKQITFCEKKHLYALTEFK